MHRNPTTLSNFDKSIPLSPALWKTLRRWCDSAPIAFIVSPEGCLLYTSQDARDCLHLPPDGVDLTNFLSPEASTTLTSCWHTIAATGLNTETPLVFPVEAGHTPFCCAFSPVFDGEDAIVAMLCLVRGPLAGAHPLPADPNVMRGLPCTAVLQGLGEPVVMLDAESRYMFVNAASEQVLGLNATQMLGRTPAEVFPGATGTALSTAHEQAFHEQRTVEQEAYFPPQARWFRLTASPLPQRSGVVVLFRDTTEQVEAERRRAEIQRQHAALLDGMLDAFFSVSAEWEFTYAPL